MIRALAAVTGAWSLACSNSEGPTVLDSGGATCVAAADAGGRLVVPAVNGELALGFDISVNAKTFGYDGGLEQITVSHGAGTIDMDGETLSALLYQKPPGPPGVDLFQGLAVSPRRWVLFWVGCSGNQPSYTNYLTSDGTPLKSPGVMGTCTLSTSTTDVAVKWPSSTLRPSLVQGFTISGDGLSYTGRGPGGAVIDNEPWTVFPFATVDCTTCTDAQGKQGWYELHSVIWQSSCSRACYGIYYLYQSHPSDIVLDWVFCLPDLGDPTNGGTSFQAAWTHN